LVAALVVVACGAFGARVAAQDENRIQWRVLPDLPNPVGVAGPFVGIHGDVLIVAGGANYPRGMPWIAGKKAFHDTIYVFEDGHWHTANSRLPRKVAYGVSISTPNGVVCIGGQDDSNVFTDVFRLEWDSATKSLQREALPPLPKPLSFAGGARVQNSGGGETLDAIFVVGGQHEARGSPGNSFYRLDLTLEPQGAFEWETMPPMPGPPRGLPAVASLAGHLYVISGRDYGPARPDSSPYAYHTDVLRYDPVESKWLGSVPFREKKGEGAAEPLCVMASAAITVGDRILVFGGATGKLLDHSLNLARDKAARTDFLAHHPGFSRDVLALTHDSNGMFTKFGRLHAPHRMPVTTTAVRWRDRIVIPSGEVSPGRRTPRVWTAEVLTGPLDDDRGFGGWNWLTLAVYLLGMVAIGLRCSRKIEGTEEFFLAGRKIPWWAAGLSIFGTQLSAITFMAIPATTFAGDWVRSFGSMTLLIAIPIVVWFYLPTFRGLNLSTAYQYLERRFSPTARTMAAILFILLQFGRMGIVLFLPSIALSAVTGMDVFACIALMGLLSIVYTVLGGIEAVIWTDVAQVIVLMGGALLALCIAISEAGGLEEVIRIGAEADKFRIAHHGVGLDSMTVPVMIIGLFFLNIIPYTSDQTVIQRYMTTASTQSAARSLWTNFWMTAPTGIIFFGLGTALYVFYVSHPELPTPLKNDEIVPWFVVHELPAGIAGIVIAAIFAASMSSLDSSMNSVSTVLIFDFYRPRNPNADDAKQLRLGRYLTLVLGLIGTATALVMASVDVKFVFDAFNKVLGLFGGALAGLFFLGIFCRGVGTAAALTGTVCGALTVGFLEVLNLTTASPPVHPYMFAAFGFIVCAVVGFLLGLVRPANQAKRDA
jgi:SSS family transporter